jgi:hypothetical protein
VLRLLSAALLLIALGLAGCGGDDGEAASTGAPETVTVTTAVSATVVTAAAPPPESAATTVSLPVDEFGTVKFASPSGNITCNYRDDDVAFVRCDLGESDVAPPPRPADCEGDWGIAFTVSETGSGERGCVTDAVDREGIVVLGYGQAWDPGPITCTSRRAGMRCENSAGHGFFISRERQVVD